MVGEGCYTSGCTSGDVGVGALLFEQALVFFDVVFLDDIIDALPAFFPKMDLEALLIAPIYCDRFWLEIEEGTS